MAERRDCSDHSRKRSQTIPRRLTLTNWGAYEVETDGQEITAVHAFAKDPDPSPIGQSLKAVRKSRVMRPAIRESWYRHGPGSGRGRRGHEPFVEVDWEVALDLVAAEIDRVRTTHGNQAIYGGSYGWASAGRFHHAQSQLHRFLASVGGFTDRVNTYSFAAGEVIVPHVFGMSLEDMFQAQPTLDEIAGHSDLVVSFGGMAFKNSQVQNGGQGRHLFGSRLETCRDRGVRFVNLSPLREDMPDTIDAEWIPLRPNTDTAVMLGLAHSVLVDGRADEGFLATHCVGWDRLRGYLLGETDGIAKSARWAGEIAGIDPGRIRSLALEMAGARTLVTCSWSVQRCDHGEQPYWMAAALAATLGQIGLPGGGVGYGYGATGLIGNGIPHHSLPRFARGPNPVSDFIPVARITDLLESPGEQFDYDGRRLTYPDTRLVYWAGGNPFHHHQDLNRLAEAWQRPDTIVVHEPFWNPLSRHADIVLPATTPLERVDIGGSAIDDFIFWMEQVIEPVGEARNDYDIFSDLSRRLGAGERFTEGRSTIEWLAHLYGRFHDRHPQYPDFDELRRVGHFQIPSEWIERPTSALRPDRDRVGRHRVVRIRRLPRSPRLDGTGRVDRQRRRLPAPPDHQSAQDTAPLPVGSRRDQPRRQGRRSRAGRDPPLRRRLARAVRRRPGAGVQRSGSVSGLPPHQRRPDARRGADADRRLVGPGRTRRPVPRRKPQCPHPGRRHVVSRPGPCRPDLPGRGGALRR